MLKLLKKTMLLVLLVLIKSDYIQLKTIYSPYIFFTKEAPFILYTHKLYTDGLGASQPVVIASWSHGKYSRDVNLFPPKMTEGYAGHRFVVAAAHRPPFVFRRCVDTI